MLKYLISLTLLIFSLYAQEEIRVQLSSDQRLASVYVSQFRHEGFPSLDAQHVNDLETILYFDLSHNGFMQLATRDFEKEELLQKKDVKEMFNPENWKNYGIAHVVKASIANDQLSLMVFSSASGSLKHFHEIPLTGNLKEDRKQMHRIADKILKALFEEDGIAQTRILYTVQAKNQQNNAWISEIWQCDWDGANARQITHEGSYCVTPVFLPAQSSFATDRFLYVSYKMGQPKIYIASIAEGKGERFVDLRGNQLLPAISPKKDKIAFICDAGGRTDLFLQPFHPEKGELGKPLQLFSYPRSTQASPTFNPDGSKIAFVSDKDGSPRIYVIPAIQSSKRASPVLITKQNAESSCPAWSPDGKKLAYSARTNGVRQIWIYDFESREERQLTDGPGNKENPAWAPDSLHLVFNSTEASSSELYLVNLNQPQAVKITKGSGKKHYPSWGR
jgi:TolB protein